MHIDAHPPAQRRLASLDGLRGVAALVVLMHHSFLLIPSYASTYYGAPAPAVGSTLWWVTMTPLKLFTAGGEAVIVFFVLSGFVLAVPVVRRLDFNWMAYYSQRIARLGIPVLASVALAAVWIMLVAQKSSPAEGPWVSAYSTLDLHWTQLLSAVDLVGGGNVKVNIPLWSLQWELIFSLALPIFVGLALALRRAWLAALAAVVIVSWLGMHFQSGSMTYLPSFLVGTILVTQLHRVRALNARINGLRLHHTVWAGLLVAGLMLLILGWLVGPIGSWPGEFIRALQPIAAGIIVVTAMGWIGLARALELRPIQWAGKISFSLYLTHVPILIFARHLLTGQSIGVIIGVGIALALAVSILFYVFIESKAHALSRRIGAWVSAAYASRVGEKLSA